MKPIAPPDAPETSCHPGFKERRAARHDVGQSARLAQQALYNIEVKNFLPRHTAGRTFFPKIKATTRLAEQVHYKFRHSLQAIEIIHQYYQRKWLFRLAKNPLRRLGRFHSDWTFWAEAAEAVRSHRACGATS